MDCLKSQNQCINAVLFPGRFTTSTYNVRTFQDYHHFSLIYIPFKRKGLCPMSLNYLAAAPDYIPALLAISPHHKNTNFFCIHFHGNACDIGQISMCAGRESQALNAHYLIVEYPGYGISHGSPNEVVFNEISLIVHEFVTQFLQIPSHQIVIIGRSIGTGPACYLSGYLQSIQQPPFALIIQSPFASIADATNDLLGGMSCCLLNRWDNHTYLVNDFKEFTQTIQSPVLFIHADEDKIINIAHSQLLHQERVKRQLPSQFYIQQSNEIYRKGHNYFDYEYDVVQPMKKFLYELLQHYQTQLSRIELNPLEHSGITPKLKKLQSLQIPKEVLKQYATIPTSYLPSRPIPKSKEERWNQEVYIEAKKSYCTILDMIGWSCCPCIFCCECSLALTCNGCDWCISCLFPALRPKFHYQNLRPPNVQQGSISQLLFRNKAFVQNLNEEDSSKTHQTIIPDKSIKPAKIIHNPNAEVQNPLVANNNTSTNHSNPTTAVAAVSPVESGESEGAGSNSPDGGVKLNRRSRLARSDTDVGIAPVVTVMPLEQPPVVVRLANEEETIQEQRRRSVNSPSEKETRAIVKSSTEDNLDIQQKEESSDITRMEYIPG